VLSAGACAAAEAGPPSQYEYELLRICEGVVRLFQRDSDQIWPGYSLAASPFIVYIPGKWALLLNSSREVNGFGPLPSEWPGLEADLLFHEGQYRDFVGQLVFDVKIVDVKTVAIGFPDRFPASIENPQVKAFAYIVHEAFHQYQHGSFGEIPWEREEKYPIEDVDNAALAYLEMRLLADAIEAMAADDRDRCRKSCERFVAVRHHRWLVGDPFVASYEQGKELLEGTANYVELKCLGLAADLEYRSPMDGLTAPLKGYLSGLSAAERLLDEFGNRMGAGSVPVGDMPRHRIYPVAGAQGFLLDYFGIAWKASAERAGTDFVFATLLRDGLDMDEAGFARLVEEAKRSFDFEAILRSTEKAIEAYTKEYLEELEAFESQPGFRVQMELESSNVSRSRTSRARRWTVQKGARCLCRHYEVYTLRGSDWSLDVHDAGLLEIEDWGAGLRTVVFYIPETPSIVLDSEFSASDLEAPRMFQSIEMGGANFRLESSRPGSVIIHSNTLKVSLLPE
jgi:hypothetical protein